ncbi:MAG: DUF3604 domain-containing protein [Hyphomicrobiales bacterium]
MPHSTYLPDQMGSATLSPTGQFEAGSYQEFTLVYTAGTYGIDDSGSIKVSFRFASDMGRPQFDDPSAPNYTSVEASNGAVLLAEYDIKRNIRPWDRTLYIKVVRGYLCEGEQITIRFGDRRKGSPGIRVQTFCEDAYDFHVFVDAIATYDYVELPEQPAIEIVSGPPVLWKAVMPTLRKLDQTFKLFLKGEDKWGNPSDKCDQSFTLRANAPIDGLPESVEFSPGKFAIIIDGLKAQQTGDLLIELVGEDGNVAATSNPLRIVEDTELLPYWGDLHGQSGETLGTNSARRYHEFARDKAFLDVNAHQGNDFQITNEFWKQLNELSAEFNVDGSFIVFPGWEWSANTSLGGDRNVLYLNEGGGIYRSSHALIEDRSDIDSDCTTAQELFTTLEKEDCIVFAHVGGRYADIKLAHDGRVECSFEVHSAWGTFEWLIEDAFEMGYRFGIHANSDGHKGRSGASHPGAAKFGCYGGLSCMLAPELTRTAIAATWRSRHVYGTSGCRSLLDTRVQFDTPAELFESDPQLGETTSHSVSSAMMGDILRSSDDAVTFSIDVSATAPIERIEIRNGLETLETFRPYEENDLGRRVRVIWEGSEYRGRGRETIWDGDAVLAGNSFKRAEPINRYNQDKRFDQPQPERLEWAALTTGGFGGFDATLEDPSSGTLKINTALVSEEIAVKEIGLDDLVFENGGIRRRIRVYRLPDQNPHRAIKIERRIKLRDAKDNGLYVCVTQEDGHQLWSSPIFIFR